MAVSMIIDKITGASGILRFMRAFVLAAVALLAAGGAVAQQAEPEGINSDRPQLLPQKGYTETWDQHIYFDDGTFITARFLIVNLAAGKPRAFVIATIVTPDGRTLTVKNGRDRGGWSFDPNKFDLHIAGHRLSGEAPDFRLHLHNATAEVLLTLRSPVAAWDVGRMCCGTSKKAYQDMIAYIPVADVEGWYRPGPDAGGKGDEEPWRPLKGGRGFATHYVNSQSVEKVARSWVHFFAFEGGQGQLPGLISLALPNGGQMTRLALLDHSKAVFESDSALVEVAQTQTDNDGNILPKVIRVTSSAAAGEGQVTGTLTFDRLLERIALKEKLTWIERLFASSLPGTAQYYYLVHYDLTSQINGVSQRMTGQGMVEYTAISKP